MKLNALLAALFLALFARGDLLADTGGASAKEIRVVDMRKLIEDSIIGKSIESNLKEEAKKRYGALEIKKNEIEKLKQDLDKQKGLLSESAANDRRSTIERKQRDLARAAQDVQDDLERKSLAEMKKLMVEVDDVLEEIAKQGDGQIVVLNNDPRSIVYAAPRLDITESVVKKLNEKKLKI